MIRTHIIPCELDRETADRLNRASGQIYTGILVAHYRTLRKKGIWLSQGAGTKWSDYRTNVGMHAHTIDAAQQGFYKACKTAKALKKVNPKAKYPHWTKKFRTTVWKNTGIKRQGDVLILSNGVSDGHHNQPIEIAIPESLRDALRFVEVRLVYDKRAKRYNWHLVIENGKEPKVAAGHNIVSVDLGEIHPAVVGDETEATIILCRERRHEKQGHAKRMASLSEAIARKKKGSRRYWKLVRSKTRMKAKHKRVQRDMEHKVSRAIVNVAVERQAETIVMGDIRDIADEVALGKKTNQKISGWNHGQVRTLTTYKAGAEGIAVILQDEKYTSQTCPNCGHRHKPKGRNYKCPSCGFRCHRDVVGQINILSAYKFGEPGKLPAPPVIKHSVPYNIRRTLRRTDTCPVVGILPVAR